MTTIHTGNVAASLPALLNLVRRGESVLLVEDGRPVAQLTPPPDEADDDRWWRGTYEPPLPVSTVNVTLPPTAPERLLPEVNADWYRSDDDDA